MLLGKFVAGEPDRAEIAAHVPASNWGWFMLRAALCLALAIAAFLFPASAVLAFTLLFAAFAAVDGLFSLVTGIKGARSKEERWGVLVLRGILGLGAGAVIALMPMAASFAYALVTISLVAGWALVTGVLEIYAALRLRREIRNEWLLATSGALSIILGLGVVVLLVINIETTIITAGWLLGLYALSAAAILAALGLRLREYQRERASESRKAGQGAVPGP